MAIETVSPQDRTRKKLDFYPTVQTSELLIIDRDPWVLELHRLMNGEMGSVGISTVADSQVLTTTVVPLSWRLMNGPDRPMIEAARLDGSQRWQA